MSPTCLRCRFLCLLLFNCIFLNRIESNRSHAQLSEQYNMIFLRMDGKKRRPSATLAIQSCLLRKRIPSPSVQSKPFDVNCFDRVVNFFQFLRNYRTGVNNNTTVRIQAYDAGPNQLDFRSNMCDHWHRPVYLTWPIRWQGRN